MQVLLQDDTVNSAVNFTPLPIVRLRPLPNVDGIRAIRAALKTLLRQFGLKCLSIEIETANLEEMKDD
jgi:hypothetical protein